MIGFLLRALITAFGLWLASLWVPGVSFDSPATLILAGILLGVVNAIVRPIAFILTLPLTILTLGLFLLVLNAGMVALVAWMLPGFHMRGGFTAALAHLAHRLADRAGSARRSSAAAASSATSGAEAL